jgi:hypothetical protein
MDGGGSLMSTYNLVNVIPAAKDIVAGDILNFKQTGSFSVSDYSAETAQALLNGGFNQGINKTITLPPGIYKLECWGAQGGKYGKLASGAITGTSSGNYGGKGGYSTGTLTLKKETQLFLYPGGRPEFSYY